MGSPPKPTTLSDGEDGLFTKPDVSVYPDYLEGGHADKTFKLPNPNYYLP